MTSPMERTLSLCRKLGFDAEKVERYNSFVKRRHDLFNAIDVLALDGDMGVLGIQVCGGSGEPAERCRRLAENPAMLRWLQSGNRLQIWAWRKVGPRGKRKTWQVRMLKAGENSKAIEWFVDQEKLPPHRDVYPPQ